MQSKKIWIVGAVVAALFAWAAASHAVAQDAKRGGDRRAEMLKKFDKNGDGRLDAQEMQAARAAMPQGGRPGAGAAGEMSREELLKKFDKNGNGRLDPDEMQAARAAMPQGGRPGAGAAGRGGREEMLKRFDKNGNGRLDPEEMEAARAGRRGQN